jgi:hypothetical protein
MSKVQPRPIDHRPTITWEGAVSLTLALIVWFIFMPRMIGIGHPSIGQYAIMSTSVVFGAILAVSMFRQTRWPGKVVSIILLLPHLFIVVVYGNFAITTLLNAK